MKAINTNYEISHLEWDTKEFNVKSCKVILNEKISKENIEEIKEYVKENEYQFITIQNVNNNEENNFLLSELSNITLVDVNMQLMKKIMKAIEIPEVEIRTNLEENKEILKIATESFTYSRFFIDNKLPENRKDVYVNWAKNAMKKNNKYFAIYKSKEQIKGFILFSYDSNCITIELVAIDKNSQHQGIGTALLQSVEKFAYDNSINELHVGTQLNNIKAQNFYIKYGFRHKSVTSIYHWWRN